MFIFKIMWVRTLKVRVTQGLKQPWTLGQMVCPLDTTILYLRPFSLLVFLDIQNDKIRNYVRI